MARIAGINIPNHQHAGIALTAIYGIGRSRAAAICIAAGIEPSRKIKDLTDAEMERMRDVLRQWLDAGAVGINTGLDYPPAAHSTTRELIELAKVVAQHGGVYASHMRYQGLGRPDALREAADIGRQAGLPINVSHESIDDDTEPIHAEARKDVDFAFDWYVYPAGSSTLLVNMPPEDQVGGIDGVMARLRDPATRARFAALAEEYLVAAYASGAREYF